MANILAVDDDPDLCALLRTFALQPIETVWGIGYRWKNE